MSLVAQFKAQCLLCPPCTTSCFDVRNRSDRSVRPGEITKKANSVLKLLQTLRFLSKALKRVTLCIEFFHSVSDFEQKLHSKSDVLSNSSP